MLRLDHGPALDLDPNEIHYTTTTTVIITIIFTINTTILLLITIIIIKFSSEELCNSELWLRKEHWVGVRHINFSLYFIKTMHVCIVFRSHLVSLSLFPHLDNDVWSLNEKHEWENALSILSSEDILFSVIFCAFLIYLTLDLSGILA